MWWQRLWAGDGEKSHGPEVALISHLLFWTGCDGERTARLLLRCEGWKARRAKWAEPRAGKSHLAYTIERARAQFDGNVYQEPAPPPLPPVATNVRSGAALMQRSFAPVPWAVRGILRSAERRVGTEWVSSCRTRL